MEETKSGVEHFAKATEAFVLQDYAKAVELYSEAIGSDGACSEYFCGRAHTLLKLGESEESKEDAVRAFELKPHGSDALLRLGAAYFKQTAYFKHSLTAYYRSMDPDIRDCFTMTRWKLVAKVGKKVDGSVSIKYNWNQTDSHTYVNILAENVDFSGVKVDFASFKMDLSGVFFPDGTEYKLKMKPFHPIVAEQSSFQVVGSQMELSMKKVDGIHWAYLEGDVVPSLREISPPTRPRSDADKKYIDMMTPKMKLEKMIEWERHKWSQKSMETPKKCCFRKVKKAIKKNDYSRAVEVFTEALGKDATCCEYFRGRAEALMKLGRFYEAKEDAVSAVGLEPEDDTRALMLLGVICFNLQQYEEAIDAFKNGANANEHRHGGAFRQWISWTEERLLSKARNELFVAVAEH